MERQGSFFALAGGDSRVVRTEKVNPRDEAPFSRRGSGFSIKSDLNGVGGTLSFSRLLRYGGDSKVRSPFKQNPFIYSAIKQIRNAMASVPAALWFVNDDDEPQELVPKSNPIARLFRRPNPLTTSRKLIGTTAVERQQWGEVLWVLLEQPMQGRMSFFDTPRIDDALPSVPAAIVPVSGRDATLELDKETGFPKTWILQNRKGRLKIPASSVFHSYWPDPEQPLRGFGPMQAAWRTAQRYYTAERYDEGLLDNGGEPGGVYTIKEGGLSDDDRKLIEETHRARVSDPESNRNALVLEEGVDYKALAFSPKDMDFRNLRLWDRDAIMAIFSTTKPIHGITDDVNRANAREAIALFWMLAILPELDEVEDDVNERLLPRIPGAERMRWIFDRDDIDALQDETGSRIESVVQLVEHGQRSFEEAAEIVGLRVGKVKGGDDRWVSASLQDADNPKPVGGEGGGEEEPPKAASDVEAKSSPPPSPDEDSEIGTRSNSERRAYADAFEKALVDEDARIARSSSRVLTAYMLSTIRKVEKLAKSRKTAERQPKGRGKADARARRRSSERAIAALAEDGLEAFVDQLDKALANPFRDVWNKQARAVAEELGSSSFVSALSEEAKAFLDAKRVALAEGAMSTVSKAVAEVIRDTLKEEGLLSAPEALAKRIESVLETLRPRLRRMKNNLPARAARIARTESTTIANAARVAEMKADGVEKSEWITSRDGLVRDTHRRNDGVVRRVGKKFPNGLRYPGDEEAKDASEIVNCRCVLAPVHSN